MDDNKFDEKTAREWINIIEDDKSHIRESDLYPLLRRWIKQASPESILDIGCGQGICSKEIDPNISSYTGLDPSAFLIKRAKQLYEDPKRCFITGTIYEMPFSNDTFEAAFSIATWHLLADLKTASCELNRVLKPNGHYLIVTADPSYYTEWMARYTDHILKGHRFEGRVTLSDGTQSSDVLYLHTFNEIECALTEVGLEVCKTEKFRSFIAISGKKYSGLMTD